MLRTAALGLPTICMGVNGEMHSRAQATWQVSSSSSVDELLGRQTNLSCSQEGRELIAASRVLVTGAGGSIGGELVRQLADLCPRALYMVDHDESLLHAVQLGVFGDGQLDHERTVLADIRDGARLERLFAQLQPDLVFHAAALKHLAMLERYPSEAIRTNTIGTRNVVSACQAAGVSRLVNVSTDKAADPTSVLGASKNLAECVVLRASDPDGLKTASVRFGNVLGSRGSFLHTLAHQINSGGSVTLTHPDVDRYFMSIPEAASLVIEAASMAHRGEIYLLDMDQPVRIAELIRRFAALNDLPQPLVRLTGLRPGEKLSEKLISSDEDWDQSPHPKIMRAKGVSRAIQSDSPIDALCAAAQDHDDAAVMTQLARCGYRLPSAGRHEPRTTVRVPFARGHRQDEVA